MAKYYHLTYAMQLVAALNVGVALFLNWYEETTAFTLMLGVLEDFVFPLSLFDTWVLLWLLPPVAFLGVARGIMGLFDQKIMYWWTALIASGLAGLSMGWFYLNFADLQGAQRLGVNIKEVGIGYWLTGSSLLLLTVLILVEKILPRQSAEEVYLASLPATDPERIWQGYYQVCPFCGSPNDPKSRRCQFCGLVLFPEEVVGKSSTPKN